MPELIKVTFQDGTQSCYKSPVYTVLDVLRLIGEDRFHEITFVTGQQKVVTQEVLPVNKQYAKEIIPGWFYINRFDTRERTNMLINLNKQFDLGLKIEVGDFDGTKDPKIPYSTRPKARIIVTMPDGDIIDFESYKDVFNETIYRLDPRRVSSKANLIISSKRDMLSPTPQSDRDFKIGDHLYLYCPASAKEASQLLTLIAMRLRDGLKVQYIAPNKNKNQ